MLYYAGDKVVFTADVKANPDAYGELYNYLGGGERKQLMVVEEWLASSYTLDRDTRDSSSHIVMVHTEPSCRVTVLPKEIEMAPMCIRDRISRDLLIEGIDIAR